MDGEIKQYELVKKLWQRAKMLKKEKLTGISCDVKSKTAEKSDNSTWRDESKDIGKRRKTQEIPRQGQSIQTKKKTEH